MEGAGQPALRGGAVRGSVGASDDERRGRGWLNWVPSLIKRPSQHRRASLLLPLAPLPPPPPPLATPLVQVALHQTQRTPVQPPPPPPALRLRRFSITSCTPRLGCPLLHARLLHLTHLHHL